MPTNKMMPYQHLEQSFSMYTLSEIMKISVKELKKEFVELYDINGFILSFLERYLRRLCEKESWDAYMDVLALALFGVMLFLKADSFVDDVAIKVFLAFKTHAENPVIAILANTYIALDQCHSGKRRLIVCCLPALFVWLIARFEERVVGIKCPVESVKQQGLETKGVNEWAQCLAGLTQTKI